MPKGWSLPASKEYYDIADYAFLVLALNYLVCNKLEKHVSIDEMVELNIIDHFSLIIIVKRYGSI